MTPDANDVCVFAIRRGDIRGRFDVNNLQYNKEMVEISVPKVSLRDLTLEEPCYGTSATAVKRNDEGQPKYIRITDFSDFGIDANHEFMTAEYYTEKHLLKKGDILFARTGGTVGKTYYYDGSIGEAVFAGYCIRFRFDSEKVNPKFVFWNTKTDSYDVWVKGIQRPSGQPNINKEEYKSFEIALPSRKDQERLVRMMDCAMEFYKTKIKHANELLAGTTDYVLNRIGLTFDEPLVPLYYATTIMELEGRFDPDYYSPKFQHFRRQIAMSPYEVYAIGEISDHIVAGFAAGKQDQADNLPEEQRIPQLRPFSITTTGELSFETQKYVPVDRMKPEDYCRKGEVIFNNTNSPDLVGKTTVFDTEIRCAVSNHMTRITVKEGVNPYYVAAFFNVLLSIGYWKLLCTNFNNQAGVNTETLKNVKIPLPPKQIQDEIAYEIMHRRTEANKLRKEAEQEWKNAKEQFERELLGG